MKIALVYDRANKIGGAERILLALHELYPDAPLYTLVHDSVRAPWTRGFQIITSFLNTIPFARRFHEFFPVLPLFAFERFDFSAFDIVISVTSTEAKGIITGPRTLHICYLLTPTRFLWSHFDEYFHHPLFRAIALPAASILRICDYFAAQRADHLIAISKLVQRRIKKYYRRESEVIYPPGPVFITQHRELPAKDKGNYYLIVSRLVRYKKIDLAIEACNKLKLPLIIVGDGLDKKRLEKLSGPTVAFLGTLTDQELSHYYQECRALLMPQAEDFGLVAIEALTYGSPVISYRESGTREVVIPGKSGELFFPQTATALEAVLEKFDGNAYSRVFCQQSVARFASVRFKKEFAYKVNVLWNDFKRRSE